MAKGLFTPRRQGHLLRGLADRCAQGVRRWDELGRQYVEQLATLVEEQRDEQQQQQRDSQLKLREHLRSWDENDEKITASYEKSVHETRDSLNRLGIEFKQRHRDGIKKIHARYIKAKNNANTIFAAKKPLPQKRKAKENARLSAAWAEIAARLESGREVALRRLHELNPPPELSDDFQSPSSVDDAVNRLTVGAEQCDECLANLDDDFAVRFLESTRLFLVLVASYALWCLGVWALGAQPLLLWILGGIAVPIVLGIVGVAALSPRLRRVTRQWYPNIEQQAVDAARLVADGQSCAAEDAKKLAAQIKNEHEHALQNADDARRQETERLEFELNQERQSRESSLRNRLVELDESYGQAFASLEHKQGDGFREATTSEQQRLDNGEQERHQSRVRLAENQRSDDEHTRTRLREGLKHGLARIDQSCEQLAGIYPDWPRVADGHLGTLSSPVIAAVGYLDVVDYLRKSVDAATAQTFLASDQPELSVERTEIDHVRENFTLESTLPDRLPQRMPVAMLAPQHSGLLIDCSGGISEEVGQLVRAVLWRLLTALPPGNLRLTLLDPVGRGQTFASLMALADHDPTLVGHRAWTQPSQIETRLAELTQYMEDVLQTYLRDNYQTIDEYNAQEASISEPYRVVAAIGIPGGLSPGGYEHLRALLENGRRCGIIMLLVRDPDEKWPHEFAPLPTDRLLHLAVDADGKLRHTDPLLAELPFHPAEPPPAEMAAELVQQIGEGAIASRRVEIPFDGIMPADMYREGDSSDGLDIPVGQQGAGRRLRMQLGEGVRQHMLVAGKTGSGKSSLLHTIITAGALRYSPDQLHVYLLDFKKGVEFKVYADAGMPHARVIGIESEREFGQSVLERLDRELQRRGELFRATGVQEVEEYRRKSGESMPRIMLVIDEFQELFIRDDRIAQDCTMLMDRLVRQGRSFGMHVILSSQSLAGAYSLPRNTMGQMAVRVALQCSESDALVILSEDNNAARLLSRPGEAIYNDAGGLVEGNHPFQVAWLDHERHRELLQDVSSMYSGAGEKYDPPVVFEGNRPARWSAAIASAAHRIDESGRTSDGFRGLLGEAVAIGPPVTLQLKPQPACNVMLVSGDSDLTRDVLGVLVPSIYGGVVSQGRTPRIVMLDGRRTEDSTQSAVELALAAGVPLEVCKPRDAEAKLIEIAAIVEARSQLDVPEDESPIVIVIDPLERFRDLQQDDSSFSFSLDAEAKPSGGKALQSILRDGPGAAVHLILCCSSVETISRWLPRQSQHDLELSILGPMSVSDSSQLIDNPEAGRLSPASMLLHDDSSGRIEKFRVFDLPQADALREWIESLNSGQREH